MRSVCGGRDAGTKAARKRLFIDTLEGTVGGRYAFDVLALRDLHRQHADASR